MVTVLISGFSGYATLESSTGRIVGDRLDGPFRIRFGKSVTGDVQFLGAADNRLRVAASGVGPTLAEAEAILFPFSGLLTVAGSGPQVFVAELKLIFESGKAGPSLIFNTASVSLLGGYPPQLAAMTIASPSGAGPGVTETPLGKATDPISQHLGFPIVPVPSGFEVRFGARINSFQISHIPDAVVQVGAKARLAILVASPDGSPLSRFTFGGAGLDQDATHRVRLGQTKSAQLALSSIIAGTPSDAFAKSGSIEGDLLSIDAFHGDQFAAAVLDANKTTLASLDGEPNQFRFALKLPVSPGVPPQGEVAQLEFADARVINDRPYRRIVERFHGLSVSGLASVRTANERLDCSHATATLVTGQPFALKAGVPLDFLDGRHELSPRLVAKRGPNGERRLEMMVAALRLIGTQGFTLDTAKNRFEIHGPRLHGRPNGPAAPLGARPAAGTYASWELQSPKSLALSLGPNLLSPEDKDWSKAFDYAADQAFRLVEHPGAELIMRRAPDRVGLLSNTYAERSELTQYKEPGGKEYLAYSTFFAVLTYGLIRHVQADEGEIFVGQKDIELNLVLLKKKDSELESYSMGVAPGDLRVLMQGGDPASELALDRFIDANLKDGNSNPEKVLFPLLDSLAILLRYRSDGRESNAFEIAGERRPGVTPRFGMDFSEVQSLGLDWAAIAQKDKALWPALSKTDAKARDPSHGGWKGLFFQNLPLNITLPPIALAIIRKDLPNLGEFLDELNRALMLDYGWRDENGTTWSARLEPQEPLEIVPQLLRSFLSIQIDSATFLGSAGKLVRAGASVAASLPFLAENGDEPPRLVGDFDFSFTEKSPIGKIALRGDDGNPIGTQAIPGFDEVQLAGFSSDFRTAQADLDLYPSAKLKSLIDVFDLPPGTPFKAALRYDLRDEKPGSLALVTEHEIRTRLLGKWPLVIQSLRLELGDPLSLKFKCQLELGFPTLRSLAVDISLQRKGNDWDFEIIPEGVGASLGIGEIDFEIDVGWTNTDQIKNEFWGKIKLSGGPIKVEQQMQLRIGSSGGRPYWIAGASLPNIRIGPAKVLKPIVLVGRGAELPGLANAITDPSKNLKMLRDSATGKTEEDWLKEWRPSSNMGTVFAASGFLSFDERLASSSEDKEEESQDGKYLTNIVFTDNGLLRIDGWFRLMSSDDLMTRVVFGLNTIKGEIAAGVQLPRIKLPGTGETKIEVFPGFAYFRIGYRGRLSFTYSLGWPERVDGPGIERDWEKATKVFIADAWPINTFWGGMMVDYRAGQSLTLGYAIRAGWTRSYPGVGAKGIAYAEAELGIAIGGVLMVNFGQPREEQPLPALSRLPSPLLLASHPPAGLSAPDTKLSTPIKDPVKAARALVEPLFSAMRAEAVAMADLPEVEFTAELFGDIWGRGSAEFLGVNIASVSISAYARFQVKGTTKRGITSMRSITGYKVSVTILCISYSAYVEVEIWIVRREG